MSGWLLAEEDFRAAKTSYRPFLSFGTNLRLYPSFTAFRRRSIFSSMYWSLGLGGGPLGEMALVLPLDEVDLEEKLRALAFDSILL